MESFETYFLNEMPLTDFQKIGKWDDKKNRHGYDKASVGILNSDSGIQKLKNVFSKVEPDFNLYFVKKPGASQYSEIGEVSPAGLESRLGIEIGKDIPIPVDDSITVFFTNNKAADRTPLTPWTIAHRIGHAFFASSRNKRYNENVRYVGEIESIIKDIFRDVYNKDVGFGETPFRMYKDDTTRNFLESIGTFRSARMKKLNRPFEFIFEAFAQYLLTGQVKLNDFPETLGASNRKAWGNPTGQIYKANDPIDADEYKRNLQYTLEHYFDWLIGSHYNTISIM